MSAVTVFGGTVLDALTRYATAAPAPLGGIGFTMSIFIADLGFTNSPEDLLMAKTGILLASALAGFGGFFWLMLQTRQSAVDSPDAKRTQ